LETIEVQSLKISDHKDADTWHVVYVNFLSLFASAMLLQGIHAAHHTKDSAPQKWTCEEDNTITEQMRKIQRGSPGIHNMASWEARAIHEVLKVRLTASSEVRGTQPLLLHDTRYPFDSDAT